MMRVTCIAADAITLTPGALTHRKKTTELIYNCELWWGAVPKEKGYHVFKHKLSLCK